MSGTGFGGEINEVLQLKGLEVILDRRLFAACLTDVAGIRYKRETRSIVNDIDDHTLRFIYDAARDPNGRLDDARVRVANALLSDDEFTSSDASMLAHEFVSAIGLYCGRNIAPLLSEGSTTAGCGKGAYVMTKHIVYFPQEGIRDLADKIFEYELDKHGNAIRVRASYGYEGDAVFSYEYDKAGYATKCIGDSRVVEADCSYKRKIVSRDRYGQPTRIIQTPFDNSESEETIDISWYDEGHVKQVTWTDIINHKWIYTFKKKGMLAKYEHRSEVQHLPMDVVDAATFSYDIGQDGNISCCTIRDKEGGTIDVSYEYDDRGNVVKRIRDGMPTDEYAYMYIEDVSPAVSMECNHFLNYVEFAFASRDKDGSFTGTFKQKPHWEIGFLNRLRQRQLEGER